MGLETKPHPEPYPIGCVCDKVKLNVTKQCRIIFSIASKLIDEVDLDVVPFDICGIVLGSPYIYDRKEVFFRHENKYHLTKGGVEYIVRDHSMRVNTTLVSAGKMKRIINTNKIYVLMVVKEKDVETSNTFQGCDPSHKNELIDIVSKYDDIFQEPYALPPKGEIQHEIHLQHDSPLPNVGIYRMPVVGMTKIKK
jgi:ABC-type cobalt transport system substrate-binding protein